VAVDAEAATGGAPEENGDGLDGDKLAPTIEVDGREGVVEAGLECGAGGGVKENEPDFVAGTPKPANPEKLGVELTFFFDISNRF